MGWYCLSHKFCVPVLVFRKVFIFNMCVSSLNTKISTRKHVAWNLTKFDQNTNDIYIYIYLAALCYLSYRVSFIRSYLETKPWQLLTFGIQPCGPGVLSKLTLPTSLSGLTTHSPTWDNIIHRLLEKYSTVQICSYFPNLLPDQTTSHENLLHLTRNVLACGSPHCRSDWGNQLGNIELHLTEQMMETTDDQSLGESRSTFTVWTENISYRPRYSAWSVLTSWLHVPLNFMIVPTTWLLCHLIPWCSNLMTVLVIPRCSIITSWLYLCHLTSWFANDMTIIKYFKAMIGSNEVLRVIIWRYGCHAT